MLTKGDDVKFIDIKARRFVYDVVEEYVNEKTVILKSGIVKSVAQLIKLFN